jgi:hypothetical protein
MPHLPPAHHDTSKHDSPNETKIKGKTKQNCPEFEFKSRQVNDSSQSNQGTDHLVSQKDSQKEEEKKRGASKRGETSFEKLRVLKKG